MKHAQLFYVPMLAVVVALAAFVVPVSAFTLLPKPKCRPTIAAVQPRWENKHHRPLLCPLRQNTAPMGTCPIGPSSRCSASKTDTATSSGETILKKDLFSSSRATLVALGLVLALETASPKPSHATSYGQFGASVSPPKTAVDIARNSGASARTTKAGATICQPISAVSTLNSNFSNKCKKSAYEVSPDGDTMSQQAIEHQRLLADLEQEPDFYIYFSAFLASTISTLIIHPLDTWKVRVMTRKRDEDEDQAPSTYTADGSVEAATIRESQSPSSSLLQSLSSSSPPLESSTALSATSAACNERPMYMPSTNAIPRRAFAEFGSLYDGILPNIVKEGPPSALYLGLYESSIILLKQYPFFTDHKLIMYLLAGAIGEVAGSIVRAPAEAVKTRVQSGDVTLGDALRTVFLTQKGRENTYKAWSSSIFRDVPAGGIQIAIFETLKLFLLDAPYIDVNPDTLLSECILGGIGGATGTYVTTPFDRITTMIISSGEEDISMIHAAKRIWSEEGAGGFFVGSRERASYWFFAVGIFLGVYCFLSQAGIPLFVH